MDSGMGHGVMTHVITCLIFPPPGAPFYRDDNAHNLAIPFGILRISIYRLPLWIRLFLDQQIYNFSIDSS